jgi:hypothetical protein
MNVPTNEKTTVNDVLSGYVAVSVNFEREMSGINATFYLAEAITITSNNN